MHVVKRLVQVALAFLLLLPGAVGSDIANPASKAKQSIEYSPHTAWELGYTGKGVAICIMDTGVDDSHPSLAGKWLGGVDVSKPQTPLTPRDGTFNADDTNGHGTTCSGIAMGTGAPEKKYQGAAPDARLVELRIGTIFGAAPGEGPSPIKLYDATLQGEQWALAHVDHPWASGGGQYTGIQVLSLSWGIDVGGSSDGSDPYSQGLDRLVEAGVIVVNAAGNDGPSNDGLTGLSASSRAIVVGATDDNDTIDRSDDIIASYSSRGPRKDNGDGDPFDELKPDVSAPGTGITQAQFDQIGDGSGNGYGPRGSGTSYATPLVAGVCALLLEANSNLTPPLVAEILRATAERRGNASAPELDPFWNRDFGWGIVDAYLACRLAARTDVENTDTALQAFATNVTNSNSGPAKATGLSWNRLGEIERTEVRIDNGSWHRVSPEKGSAFGNWSYPIEGIPLGNHTLYVRNSAGGKSSLVTEFQFVMRGGSPPPGPALFSGGIAWAGAATAAAAVAGVTYWFIRKRKKGANAPSAN
jgi:subtilisin family serine protease